MHLRGSICCNEFVDTHRISGRPQRVSGPESESSIWRFFTRAEIIHLNHDLAVGAGPARRVEYSFKHAIFLHKCTALNDNDSWPILMRGLFDVFIRPFGSTGEGTMTLNNIEIPRERIVAFCRANGIRRLALYGSILRDDFRPESDIDVLVEFQPGVRVGLNFMRMQDELSAIFNHTVDLNTPAGLSKYFKTQVLNEAESLYVAA